MGDNLNQTSDQSKNFLNRDEQSIFADTKICPLSTLDFDDDQSKSQLKPLSNKTLTPISKIQAKTKTDVELDNNNE